ncbi:MAG: peroxisome assembly protein (Peroxin-2) [Thelocarpon superellum]|nr:MAG: peroxisome assembly protein (Peroxin-2) [Thelocarpon superellum]
MTSSDFLQAQQRLAARRQARQAAVQAAEVRSGPTAIAGPSTRLDGLRLSGAHVWSRISGREGTQPAFRVGQVDAELLDEELLALLKSHVGEALKYFGSHLTEDWSAEILLILRTILFKLSLWDHDATYGAALQNLRYTDARKQSLVHVSPSRWQKGAYGLVTVGGKYAWGKWENWLTDQDGGYEEPPPNVRLLSKMTMLLSNFHSVAAFASFLVFLVNGKYRTLLDRVLRLRLMPPTSQISREVSFEYLNRQLVWHAFTEFLLFVLPLVGIGRWRRWLARAWRSVKSLGRRTGAADEADENKGGELAFLPERTCAICYQDQNPTSTSESEILAVSGASGGVVGSAQTDVTNPYETIPCGCIYCFVCLGQRLEAEEGEGWICLRCGELVRECKPWNGDVLEEMSRPATATKRVGFAEDDEPVVEKMARQPSTGIALPP